MDVIARLETYPLKPVSHETDFWFDEAFPEVARCLDLQGTDGQVRCNKLGRFTCLHNAPFAVEHASMSLPTIDDCT